MIKLSEKQKKIITDVKRKAKAKKTSVKKKLTSQGRGGGRKTLKSGVSAATARKHVADKITTDAKVGMKTNIEQAKRKAGYAESSIKDGSLLKTKSFREIIDKNYPDAELADDMKEYTKTMRIFTETVSADVDDADIEEWIGGSRGVIHKVIKTRDAKTIMYWMRDPISMGKGLEMMAKIKGLYAQPQSESVSRPYAHMTDAELQQAIDDEERKLDRLKNE